jgi:DNA modification methylase
MAVLEREALRQRADFTYKFNAKTGRHGWLRLTPAYSLKIVEDLIVEHHDAKRILDPFCGTGTTALSAAYHGREGVTIDINPFLVWFGRAKTANYSSAEIQATQAACNLALDLLKRGAVESASLPSIHNIERWWNSRELAFLGELKAAIAKTTKELSVERTLLMVSFCRTLMKLSNAAFNHQSMSFKDEGQIKMDFKVDLADIFSEDAHFVLEGASQNPDGKSAVFLGDSRNPSAVVEGKFDLVITSPPYANRMSYIRELRPYMYWLDFLKNGRDAGELDWDTIGGTWGIATSRLSDWECSSETFKSKHLVEALEKIAHADNKNGALLSKYVAKYFDDMWFHFKGLSPALNEGAEIHYIVGNSTFYGCVVSTELLYAEMLKELGFRHVECIPIRKRNSKKELIEFDVVARWK